MKTLVEMQLLLKVSDLYFPECNLEMRFSSASKLDFAKLHSLYYHLRNFLAAFPFFRHPMATIGIEYHSTIFAT